MLEIPPKSIPTQIATAPFAILAANAAEYDPVEMYKVELLAGPRDEADDQTMAESYVRTQPRTKDTAIPNVNCHLGHEV